MAQLRSPFRLNVGFFSVQPPGYQRDFPFDIDEYTLEPDMALRSIRGELLITRAQQGLRVEGAFHAIIKIACVRCLEEIDFPLETQFEEVYNYPGSPLSEDEQAIPEDGFIDFEPVLRDYLILEIPITSLCRADCKGLCSICGQNLNQQACEHHPTLENK